MNSDDRQFIDRVRHHLDQRLEGTPAHVASQLNAARQEAIGSHRRRVQPHWFQAAVTAMLLVAVVSGTWLLRGTDTAPETPLLAGLTQQADDFEMLTRSDDLALYADMDFYRWLDKRGMNAG